MNKVVTFIHKIFCKIGWHAPLHKFIYEDFNGCNVHAKCPWCGYEGMIDSQGNLF